jgi:hypothetical protein
MSKGDSLNPDLLRIREILARVRDPYQRYQLTLLLETAARFFSDSDAENERVAVARRKPKCKPGRITLPN